MALNDQAVITPAVGYLFTNTVGTTSPTSTEITSLDLDTFDSLTTASWSQVGHTSRDDLPEFGFEGGDKEIKGTWQQKRLREIATGDPVADSVTIILEQFDLTSLELYYGANAADTVAEPGVFGVSGDFVPVEKSLFILIVDGDVRVGFYAPKASISRDDSIALPVDGFAGLPVKASFLNYKNKRLYDWISDDLLTEVV